MTYGLPGLQGGRLLTVPAGTEVGSPRSPDSAAQPVAGSLLMTKTRPSVPAPTGQGVVRGHTPTAVRSSPQLGRTAALARERAVDVERARDRKRRRRQWLRRHRAVRLHQKPGRPRRPGRGSTNRRARSPRQSSHRPTTAARTSGRCPRSAPSPDTRTRHRHPSSSSAPVAVSVSRATAPPMSNILSVASPHRADTFALASNAQLPTSHAGSGGDEQAAAAASSATQVGAMTVRAFIVICAR